MPARISPASALVPLFDWLQAHGRAPTAEECKPHNGLVNYSTYVRHYLTMSAAVSAALELGLSNLCVSAVSALRGPQVKQCLQCSATIRNQGSHIRHCRRCRQRMFAIERDHGDAWFTGQVHLRLAGLDESWEGLLDEVGLQCH